MDELCRMTALELRTEIRKKNISIEELTSSTSIVLCNVNLNGI